MRRKIEAALDAWKARKGHGCLLIRGARQVGKTYSVERFARERYDYHLTVDLSLDERARAVFDGDLDVDRIVIGLTALFQDSTLVPGRTLIFLDEIQECPRARTALKSFAADGRYDVIATGSLLGLRRSEVPSYPVGYEEELTMGPMDFEEFLWAIGIDEGAVSYVRECIGDRRALGEDVHGAFSEYMRWYMVVGGMPRAVRTFAEERKLDNVFRVQSDIVAGYMDDVGRHARSDERMNILRCLDSVGVQLSKGNRRFKYSEIEGSDKNTGSSHYAYALEWLENAGITMRCDNVSEPASPLEERRTGAFKLYMMDTGLLLSRYSRELRFEIISGDPGVNRGALAENMVASMLASQERGLFYLSRDRDASGSPDRMELDFLILISGRVTAVEVKSGSNRDCRSLNKAMSRHGVGGIMLETRDVFEDDRGVLHLPMYAAAFLDALDPRTEPVLDFGSVDRVNAAVGRAGGRRPRP